MLVQREGDKQEWLDVHQLDALQCCLGWRQKRDECMEWYLVEQGWYRNILTHKFTGLAYSGIMIGDLWRSRNLLCIFIAMLKYSIAGQEARESRY